MEKKNIHVVCYTHIISLHTLNVSWLMPIRMFVTTFLLSLTNLSSAQQQNAGAGCRPIADVIFLLDGSDSISEQEFSQQLDFIKRFVQLSDISPDSVRVGLTVVSSTIGDEFPLSLNSTKENLLHVLNTINQPQEGSRTDLGLVEMEQLFNRHARRGVLRIGVILTDGRAKYVRATEGEARVIKDAGVFLIAVGVGRLIKYSELEKIASTTSNAYNLEPIDSSTRYLAETVAILGQEACTGHNLLNQLNKDQTVNLPGGTIASSQGQANIESTLTNMQELQMASQPLLNSNTQTMPSQLNKQTGSSQMNSVSMGGIQPGSVQSAVDRAISPMLISDAAKASRVSATDAVDASIELSLIGPQKVSSSSAATAVESSIDQSLIGFPEASSVSASTAVDTSIDLSLIDLQKASSGSAGTSVDPSIDPSLINSAETSSISAGTAVDHSIDPSLIGLEYISANIPGSAKSVEPLTDIFRSNVNSLNQNKPGQIGLAVQLPVADQLMLNLDSINGNRQSVPTNSAVSLADMSQINLQFSNRNMPGDNTNQFGNMLKQNSFMSIGNNFDVKMEPFVAVDTIKSKILNQQSLMKDSNINFEMLGSSGTAKDQAPYNVQIGNGQQPLTRFAAPQLVYNAAPAIEINITTPAPQQLPVINSTPKMPATTKSTKSQPNGVKIQEKSPSAGETANMIIQSMIANRDLTNGILPEMNAGNGVTPSVLPTKAMSADIIPTRGVSVNVPGRTVAETLAFLKQEIKPARTVEEHLNPIFQMFDATGPAQNNWRTKAATVQPTTTTMSPRDAYQRAEHAALRDYCSNGRFVDGIAYISKPGTCSEFVQCYKEGKELKVRVARCPFETFFDDVHSLCRHYTKQSCMTDPCVDNTIASYAYMGNCRAYWNCQRGKSRPACCPSGTSYVPGFGCARNATCLDTCMDFGNLNEVTHASKCKLLSMDADPHFYFEHVAGMGWMVRMCAQGSQFDQIHCKCQSANEVVTDVCKPELYMDFQGGLVDVSGNNLAMGIYNVELDGGTGAFIGKSHLKLWRFSGMSLGQHVTISFRFRTSVTAKKGRLMHIVSNCCYSCAGEPEPSLDIAIIPADQGGVAVFSTTTREAGEIFLFVPFNDTFTGWNNLEYRYDGLKMRGTVNRQSAQKSIVGNIIGKSEPLLIGSCGQTNAYDGFLDEFKFYMCNP